MKVRQLMNILKDCPEDSDVRLELKLKDESIHRVLIGTCFLETRSPPQGFDFDGSTETVLWGFE